MNERIERQVFNAQTEAETEKLLREADQVQAVMGERDNVIPVCCESVVERAACADYHFDGVPFGPRTPLLGEGAFKFSLHGAPRGRFFAGRCYLLSVEPVPENAP